MRKRLIILFLITISIFLGGCSPVHDVTLRSRLYLSYDSPCVTLLFPFDVKIDRFKKENVAGIDIATQYLTSESYTIRVITMTVSKGFFREKMLQDVYEPSMILYSRGFADELKRSGVVVVQETDDGCTFLKGRVEHRLDDRAAVNIDFRKRLSGSSDIKEEIEKMKNAVNFTYDKLIVSRCMENGMEK